jgi:DNA repair exonuclease SbcCD ATPase subunit
MQKSDKINEIEILEMLHKKKIENLEKNINNLNSTINELINENNKQPKEFNYFQIQSDIFKSFSEYEQKIRKYDEDNFLLKKENQKLKNENEELKIIINGKENIIDKLQSNISKIENEFKAKLIEINSKYNLSANSSNQNNNIEKVENDINDNNNLNNNENIEKMMEEQRRLIEENAMLKGNYEQMMQGIDEANALFLNKQNEYENIINVQNEKLKEYKYKISLLKIKINELHSEIGFLQEKEIKNQNNFFQPVNDNLISNIDKERQSLDFNFTPDQIKFANNYGSASGSPDNNQNENANY